ncbi:MAG: YdcF family protein [Clostridia bacterium]|nr:YdcF family protein [Clostridia bacterium]
MKDFLSDYGLWIIIASAPWVVLFTSALCKPQRFRNSFLLLGAILVTLIAAGSAMGDYGGYFLLGVFLVAAAVLFTVPVLLIVNGFITIKKEGRSLSHLLSLFLGIFVGAGEIAVVYTVLKIGGFGDFRFLDSVLFFIGMSIFYICFVILAFVAYVIFIQIMPHRMRFDYIIIHGAGLINGNRISKLFAARIDKAIEVYNKCNVKPVIIPSGGKGDDELISEADAMRQYLIEHGIPNEKILPETSSTTTMENLSFSKDLILSRTHIEPDIKRGIPLIRRSGSGPRVALVSSNYHIYRCLSYASEIGMECVGIGAKVAPYYWVGAVIREFAAVFRGKKHMLILLLGYLLLILIPSLLLLFN